MSIKQSEEPTGTLTRALTGRRALVTGGSRGIGAAIVRRLAADGAAVAFTYNSSPEHAEKVAAEAASSGSAVVALQADSGDVEAIRGAVDDTVAHLGGLDILVNNAGISYNAPIESYPPEEFDRMMAVNVRAVFTAIQAATPHLGAGGRIINLGSIGADRYVPAPGFSVYSLTKAAVAGLTRALAHELGPRDITVNNIAPGPTATDMSPDDESEFASYMRTSTALGRFGQPHDIASAVAYLALPEAGYITGVTWYIDGGYTS